MITDQDLPALYRVANAASFRAQRTFLLLNRWTLSLLCLGAVLAILASLLEQAKSAASGMSAAIIVISAILNSVANAINPEKVWYGSRAVAESVKTLTWRYMAGAEPFPLIKPIREVEQEFAERLRKILEERKQLAFAFASNELASLHISDKMRHLRAESFEQRKAFYIKDRVLDQRTWYSKKAEENQKNSRMYFGLTVASQILAALFAIFVAAHPDSKVNAASLFTTLASAFIAWMQVRQYSSLAQSYAVTAIELGLIYEEGKHLADDGELAAFVADAENAISREHTLWVARRDRS